MYVHVLNWGSPLLALPPIASKIASAHFLPGGDPVDVTQNADGVILKVPAPKAEETDRVIVLTVNRG